MSDKELLEMIKGVIKNSPVMYMYVHKIPAGYVCMGKLRGKMLETKELEQRIRHVLEIYGKEVFRDGELVAPVHTVIIKPMDFSDETMKMNLVRAGFTNEDCIVNQFAWLDKEELRLCVKAKKSEPRMGRDLLSEVWNSST